MTRLSKFIDTTKCTACRGCQTACKSWNELPAEILVFKGYLQTHTDTSPETFTYVQMSERFENGKHDWFFLKRQCMHCTDAACIKVCPEKAISSTEGGAVVRDYDKCMGCNYCAQYCPFKIPKIKNNEKMFKCHLCSDRISSNLKPACAKTCATGALQFGPRHEMLELAQERIAAVKKKYPNANLYGLDSQFLEGTNVFYLLQENPEFYGLPAKPKIPAIAGIWKDVIQPIGKVLPIGVIGTIAASMFMNRVNAVKASQHGQTSSNRQSESKGGDING